MSRVVDITVPASLFVLALVSYPSSAIALDWSVKLEPGMAAAVGDPQVRLFRTGFGASLKGMLGLGRYLDAQAGLTFIGLPASAAAPSKDFGGAWGVGAGLRLKRPRDLSRGYSPWLDGDLMYVRTGELDRFGFSIGAGWATALDADRRFWLGPFVRYLQIVQGEHAGADVTDAKIFIVGASLEFGSSHRRPLEAVVSCSPSSSDAATDRDGDGVIDSIDRCPDQPGPHATYGCPDRDGDGLANVMDVCPDAPGPPETHGCPIYKKVVVTPEKLELKEKIRFAWDKATIESQSNALLDDVVQALKDNRSFRVRIEGHTDSSGPETHNQTLSEERARAVLDYLVTHGVPAARLGYEGFSSSQPLDRNDTEAGREANRRVEFVVSLKIMNNGSAK